MTEFLEMLRGKLPEQMKVARRRGKKAPFPYESADFTDAIEHSVWYMPDVASCFAMRDMLEAHPYFSRASRSSSQLEQGGPGGSSEAAGRGGDQTARDEGKSGSITLSCGKLMTGVTIREWGAIFMLRSLKSPESYFQAAFRVQSPWSSGEPDGTVEVQKETVLRLRVRPQPGPRARRRVRHEAGHHRRRRHRSRPSGN